MATVNTDAIFSFTANPISGELTFATGNSLPGLTAEEAVNVSEFTRAYLEGLYAGLLALPQASRPTKLAISKSTGTITGQPNQSRLTYTIVVDVNIPQASLTVVPE